MFIKGSDRLAIIDFDGTRINYYQMEEKIKYISRLIFNNIKKDEHVLIVCENRKEWIYSFFGIWDRKAIPVCIDALCNEDELTYFINDCDPIAIITSNETNEHVKNVCDKVKPEIHIYNVDDMEILSLKDDEMLTHPMEDETALMVYTSGTTGNSKGVMLSFNNLIGEIKAIQGFNVTFDDEQILSILPNHHILPLMSTCLYFYYYENQYQVVLLDKLNAHEILKKLNDNDITIIAAVPRVFELFYKSLKDKIEAKFITRLIYSLAKKVNNKKFSKIIFKKVHDGFGGKLRTFIAGGAKSNTEMIEFFEVLGFDYCEGYGLSETAPVIAGSVKPNYKIGTVGKPVVNAEIKIVNGELWVKGPMVMKGYYNKPDKTKEVLTDDGWFKTGDLATIDKDGFITIVGRANAMIVLSNGKNIDPEKIENKILKLSNDMILEVGVFGKNNVLSALIVPKAGVSNISTYIRDIIQIYNKDAHNYEKILDYKIINEELPKTRIGKPRRFKFPELFGSDVQKKKIDNEPKIKEYKILKEYLYKQKNTVIGPDENFEIEAGLDSLDLVELISYIENSFGIKMSEEILAENSNLRLLSEYISKVSSEFNENEVKIDQILKNAKIIKRNSHKLQLLFRPLIWLIAKIYFRFTVKGKEKIRKEPTIFISNHESFVDAPLLSLALPSNVQVNTYYLGLKKYLEGGAMDLVAKGMNVIKLDISNDIKGSLEEVANVLKQGYNVLIFPEGSRTKDGKLGDFKKVFAIISKELNIPIQSLYISGAYEAYSRFDKFPKPKKIQIEVLGTTYPTNKTYEEITNECYNMYKAHKEANK